METKEWDEWNATNLQTTRKASTNHRWSKIDLSTYTNRIPKDHKPVMPRFNTKNG